MKRSRCHSCIQQQNWISLFRLLLRMTSSKSELEKLGFEGAPLYDQASQEVFGSQERWNTIVVFLDNKLATVRQYDSHSIVDLLELWSQQRENASKDVFLTLLWALLRRREECPYRICSKLLHQLEDLTLRYLFNTRVA